MYTFRREAFAHNCSAVSVTQEVKVIDLKLSHTQSSHAVTQDSDIRFENPPIQVTDKSLSKGCIWYEVRSLFLEEMQNIFHWIKVGWHIFLSALPFMALDKTDPWMQAPDTLFYRLDRQRTGSRSLDKRWLILSGQQRPANSVGWNSLPCATLCVCTGVAWACRMY